MRNNSLILPSTKGVIGNWIYYSAILTFKEISERIQFPSEVYRNKNLSDMIQRNLKAKRATDIKDYLLENNERFFGSIIVGAYGGKPEWHEITSLISESNIDVPPSVLTSLGLISLSGDETLFALDGQHRLAGIRDAIESNPNLSSEELSIIFVSHDVGNVPRTRKLFISLNKHAAKVSKKDIIALDEDDNCAIITRKLLENYPPFRERLIDCSGNPNLKKNDYQNITSILSLYDIIEILIPHFKKSNNKVDVLRHRMSDDNIEETYKKFTHFFDLCFENFPELNKLKESSKQAIFKKNRHEEGGHLLFRPIGWKVLADVISHYLEDGYSVNESLEHFCMNMKNMQLNEYPFNEIIWDSTKKKIISSGFSLASDLSLLENQFKFESHENACNNIATRYKNKTGRDLPACKSN